MKSSELVLRFALVVAVATVLVPASVYAKDAHPGHYSVKDFGAVGDGTHKDTAAIQKAVDTAEAAGGGTVHFPPGTYLSGTIHLKSRVTLDIGFGATLLGSADGADYPAIECSFRSYTDNYVRQALLWGENLHDLAIGGHGTIDGQGAAFQKLPWLQRPYVIRLITCQNVTIEDLTLRNSPMWMQHYLACDNLVVRGIQVYNHCNANNDMIDIDCCHDVRISDCLGDTDDDALTLKSTADRATENVVVTNCILASHCNALKMGTESNGGFKNITVTNCVVRRSDYERPTRGGRPDGLAGIALETVDGGTFDQVTISNMAISGVAVPIFLRLGNRARPFKPDQPKPDVGHFGNVVISNIVARQASPIGCSITGLPDHPIENVTLSDIRISFVGGGTQKDAERVVPELPEKYPESGMFGTLPSYGLYCRHVAGLSLRNAEFRLEGDDHRPAMICDDVSGLDIDQLRADGAADAPSLILLSNVRQAMIRGCRPENAAPAFLRLQGACESISVIGNDLSRPAAPFSFENRTLKKAIHAKANLRSN